jgi:hypothetical protein
LSNLISCRANIVTGVRGASLFADKREMTPAQSARDERNHVKRKSSVFFANTGIDNSPFNDFFKISFWTETNSEMW